MVFAALRSLTSQTVFMVTFSLTLQVLIIVPLPLPPDPIIAKTILSFAPKQEGEMRPEAPNVITPAPVNVFFIKFRLSILFGFFKV